MITIVHRPRILIISEGARDLRLPVVRLADLVGSLLALRGLPAFDFLGEASIREVADRAAPRGTGRQEGKQQERESGFHGANIIPISRNISGL